MATISQMRVITRWILVIYLTQIQGIQEVQGIQGKILYPPGGNGGNNLVPINTPQQDDSNHTSSGPNPPLLVPQGVIEAPGGPIYGEPFPTNVTIGNGMGYGHRYLNQKCIDLFSAIIQGYISKDQLYNTAGYSIKEKINIALALESPNGRRFFEKNFDAKYGAGRSEEMKNVLRIKNPD